MLDGEPWAGGHGATSRQRERLSVLEGAQDLPGPVSSISGQGRRAAPPVHLLRISVARRSCPSDFWLDRCLPSPPPPSGQLHAGVQACQLQVQA